MARLEGIANSVRDIARRSDRLRDESGAVVVITALLLIVLMGSVAFAIDLARLRHERQVLQTAVDLGALAGSGKLPAQGVDAANEAIATARRIALENAPQLAGATLDISFRCAVSDPEGNGGADSTDVQFACGPDGGGGWPDGWNSRRGRAFHACDPYIGEKCNTIVASGLEHRELLLRPGAGHRPGLDRLGGRCVLQGLLRPALEPARRGHGARPLDEHDERRHGQPEERRALGAHLLRSRAPARGARGAALHPSRPTSASPTRSRTTRRSGACGRSRGCRATTTPAAPSTPSSEIVQRINCLQRATNLTRITPNGSGHTDLGDPMATAHDIVVNDGRPDVPDVIIFMTDGEANQPRFNQPCDYLVDRALDAEDDAVGVYVIAYGVAAARCTLRQQRHVQRRLRLDVVRRRGERRFGRQLPGRLRRRREHRRRLLLLRVGQLRPRAGVPPDRGGRARAIETDRLLTAAGPRIPHHASDNR